MKAFDNTYYNEKQDVSLTESDLKEMIQENMERSLNAVITGQLKAVSIPFAIPEMVQEYLTEQRGWDDEYELDSNGWDHDFNYTWRISQNGKSMKYTLNGSTHYGGLKFYLDTDTDE